MKPESLPLPEVVSTALESDKLPLETCMDRLFGLYDVVDDSDNLFFFSITEPGLPGEILGGLIVTKLTPTGARKTKIHNLYRNYQYHFIDTQEDGEFVKEGFVWLPYDINKGSVDRDELSKLYGLNEITDESLSEVIAGIIETPDEVLLAVDYLKNNNKRLSESLIQKIKRITYDDVEDEITFNQQEYVAGQELRQTIEFLSTLKDYDPDRTKIITSRIISKLLKSLNSGAAYSNVKNYDGTFISGAIDHLINSELLEPGSAPVDRIMGEEKLYVNEFAVNYLEEFLKSKDYKPWNNRIFARNRDIFARNFAFATLEAKVKNIEDGTEEDVKLISQILANSGRVRFEESPVNLKDLHEIALVLDKKFANKQKPYKYAKYGNISLGNLRDTYSFIVASMNNMIPIDLRNTEIDDRNTNIIDTILYPAILKRMGSKIVQRERQVWSV